MLHLVPDAHSRPITCLQLRGSVLVTGSYDGFVKVWRLAAMPPAAAALQLDAGAAVMDVAWLSRDPDDNSDSEEEERPSDGAQPVAPTPAAGGLAPCTPRGRRQQRRVRYRSVLVTALSNGSLHAIDGVSYTVAGAGVVAHAAAIVCLRTAVVTAPAAGPTTHRVLTGCRDGSCGVWSVVVTDATAASADSAQRSATTASVGAPPHAVADGADGDVRVEFVRLATLQGHRRFIAVGDMDAYRVLTASWDGVRLWVFGDDAVSGAVPRVPSAHAAAVVAWNRKRSPVVACVDCGAALPRRTVGSDGDGGSDGEVRGGDGGDDGGAGAGAGEGEEEGGRGVAAAALRDLLSNSRTFRWKQHFDGSRSDGSLS